MHIVAESYIRCCRGYTAHHHLRDHHELLWSKYPATVVGALRSRSRHQLGLQHAHKHQSRYPAPAIRIQRPFQRPVRKASPRKTPSTARWKRVRTLRPTRRLLLIPNPSFSVAPSPADALALTNCLIVHPQDFPPGQHVHINGQFALTVK